MPKGLAKSPTSNKLFITFFLLFMGYAFFVSCLNFHERTKFLPKRTLHHYAGNESNLNVESDGESDYEYNDDLMQEGFIFPKSKREIIEITHVHAFAIPLVIFVMSRIFSMTLVRDWIKIAIYTAAFIGTIMQLSGPWLVRFTSGVFTISLITSYFILGFCFLFLISLTLYELWFGKKE